MASSYHVIGTYAAGPGPRSVTTADLGNGQPDLIVADEDGGVDVLMNQGGGSFAPAVSYAAGSLPYSVTTADLGNGRPDIIVADLDGGGVDVLVNQGGGSFAAAVSYATGLNPGSVTAADLGNGQQDIIVSGDGGVSVLMNQGGGSFAAAVIYNAGADPASITTADLGNGQQDIVVADYLGGVSVLMNQGNGSFAAAVSYAAGSYPLSVTTADLTGDGRHDIIVADALGGVDVLMNQGNGSFAAAVSYAAGLYPYAVTTADLGNGQQDIIVTSQNGGVEVLMNQGNGSFAPAVSYTGGNSPTGVTTADLSGPLPDIVAADFTGNDVFILGTGPGIAPATPVAVEQGQATVLGTVSPDQAGDTLSVAPASAIAGTLTLGAVQSDGTQQVIYTAPASITTSGADTVSYVVTDSDGTTSTSTPQAVTLDGGPAIASAQPGIVEQNQTTVIGTVTPGEAGDALTLVQAQGALGTVALGPVQPDGTQQVIYIAPGSVAASGPDNVSYTVTDQHDDAVASGTASVTLDAGPSVAASVPPPVEQGETTLLGTVTPGQPGDMLTLSQTAGSGMVTLGPVQSDGTQQVTYTAPASISASGLASVSYTVTDQHGDALSSNSATVTLDAGPSVVAAVPGAVEQGQSTVIGTVTPGETGDALRVSQATGALGTVSLGAVQPDNTQQVIYTAPAGVPASATDTVSYTVTDQHDDAVANNSATVTLDAGPSVVAATPDVVEQGQTTILGTVTPGEPGDMLSVTQSAGTLGTVSLGVAVSGTQQVIYTAPASVATSGTDAVGYSITDQLGAAVASGSASVTLDAGPSVTPVAAAVEQGQTTIIGAVTPGEAGDMLTLTQAAGSLGTVALGALQIDGSQLVTYTAPASIPVSTTDPVSYSITDQHGDAVSTLSASVTLDAGATIAATAPGIIEQGQTTVLGTVTPGEAGDTLSVTQAPGALGTVSLGVVQPDGTQPIIYTAPAGVTTDATDTVSYSISDQHGDVVASNATTVSLDAGPTITPATPSVIEGFQTTVLGTVKPGLVGDTLSVSTSQGTFGTVSLGPVQSDGSQQIIYAPPGDVPGSTVATFTYTVTDQHDAASASRTASVTLDGGPVVSPQTPNTLEAGQTTVLATVSPGEPGDTLTLRQIGSTPGSIALGAAQSDGSRQVLYTAPASLAATATAAVSYEVSDQHNSVSSGGTANVALAITPFAGLVVAAADASATLSVSLTLDPSVSGGFVDLGSGSLSANGTTYTVTGTAAEVNATLHGLGFASASSGVTQPGFAVDFAATGTSATLYGQPGADHITGADGPLAMVGDSAGATVTAAASGGEILVAGTSGETLDGTASSGGDVFFGAAAGGTLFKGGAGHDTIVGGGGANTIASGAGGSVVFLGDGQNLVQSQGADTIVGSSGNDTIDAGAGGVVLFAGTGSTSFIGDAARSTVIGGAGAITVSGGAGGGAFYGSAAGGNLLQSGTGNAFLVGAATGDQLIASGSASDILVAGGGNETLNAAGSAGDDLLYGGSGSDAISLGSGADTLLAGAGSASVTVGAGSATMDFVAGHGGGGLTVTGFDASQDRLALFGFGSGEAASALQNAVVSGGNTALTLSDGTHITLVGVSGLGAQAFS